MAIHDIVWYRAYKTSDLDTVVAQGADKDVVSAKALAACVRSDNLVGDADTRDGRVVGWLPGHTNLIALLA